MKYISNANFDEKVIFEQNFSKDKILPKEETDLNENVFDSNTLCLDISELNDSISKTFLYLTAPVFNYFSRNKKNIQFINSIMKECLPEGDKILYILEDRVCLLKNIVCLADGENKYWIKDPFKLYNQGIALIHFKKMDEDIQLISLGGGLSERQDNLLLLVGIQETITFWNYGLVSVLWENFGYKYSSKYGLAVLNGGYLQDVISMFKGRYSVFAEKFYDEIHEQKISDIMDMFYLLSKHEIDLKCNSLRIQYAELAYMYSPFVEESRKKDIGILFDILWKVFCDCEIARVYIEENEYKTRKDICEVGRQDRTTRIHIIFSLKNNDIYSLRIDMPHKGVEYVHINLQELYQGHVYDSAVPIMDDEVLEEVKTLLDGNIEQFFYESGEDLWWFRIGFMKKIEEIDDEQKVQRLRDIFERQKHFEVKIITDGYELFNDFKYYLKLYLSRFVQINHPFDIVKEILMYRCVLWSREMTELLYPGIDTEAEIDEKIHIYITAIKKELYNLAEGFSERELDELTWREVVELLVGEFWNMS